MFKSNKKAFSLIELAIVILVIALVIAAVLSARVMVSKFHMASARKLTENSPVSAIRSNALWVESSLESSFFDMQADDGENISWWNDNNFNRAKKVSVVAVGDGGQYSNSINNIHAVKFLGSDENYLKISDGSFLNNSDYTIFVLEKRQSNSSDNYFFGESSSNANDAIALGYSDESTIIHAQGSNSYNSAVSTYSSSAGKARLFTFMQGSSQGKKTYINGLLAGQDASNVTQLSGIEEIPIGKEYSGEIGEIIIFTKYLNDDERHDVEDYLAQKWKRRSNRDRVSGGSCTSGTVTDSGCSMSCSVTTTGVSSPTSLSDGQSSITGTCGATGYSGTVSLSCSDGSLSVTGSCSCASGYTSDGEGGCRAYNSCSSTTITGTSSATGVVAHGGSGTKSCDAKGYSGTAAYSCSDGTLSVTTACSFDPCSVSGSVTTDESTVAGDVIYTFSGSGTINCDPSVSAQVLLVGGGGGGSADVGGGGGGGQVVSTTATINGLNTVSVGAGGARGYNRVGNSTGGGSAGGTSSISGGSLSLSALGGSGARGRQGAWNNFTDGTGYTGGGAGYPDSGGTSQGSTGTGGASFKGGNSSTSGGSGGGGAGGAGYDRASGANGGIGVASTITGSSTYYGGGGGGSGYGVAGGSGGLGGGGDGTNNTTNGYDGTDGLGGGGGGAGSNGSASGGGGTGGSGVVIIRFTK